jgi:hypothetical protein
MSSLHVPQLVTAFTKVLHGLRLTTSREHTSQPTLHRSKRKKERKKEKNHAKKNSIIVLFSFSLKNDNIKRAQQ